MANKLFDLSGKRIFLAGHRGMVGSAIARRLSAVKCEVITATRSEVDLMSHEQTINFLSANAVDVVIVAAAKVGGIHANNSFPADYLYDNLAIATSVIHGAYLAGIKKLLFLGSSCIYPRLADQPIKEESLLAGPLEPTNEWYAIAKIAGIKLCQAYRRQHGRDFVSIMPTNLYGPGDNYHPENSHVVAALIRRFHEAKVGGAATVAVWGTGMPRREFLFVDDLADACVYVLENYSEEQHVNVGTGEDLTIADFARLVAGIVGFRGSITFDSGRPDGAPRKLLDVSRLTSMGWTAKTPLHIGLKQTYADFLAGGGRGY
jgi:GDP-L-fucose synthase